MTGVYLCNHMDPPDVDVPSNVTPNVPSALISKQPRSADRPAFKCAVAVGSSILVGHGHQSSQADFSHDLTGIARDESSAHPSDELISVLDRAGLHQKSLSTATLLIKGGRPPPSPAHVHRCPAPAEHDRRAIKY